MKRRVYFFSILMVATAGLVALGAEMQKGNGFQDRIRTIPEAWGGTWEVTVSYRDRQTGALVATDITTEQIGTGEPIIPPTLNAFVRCSDVISDNEISISCRNRQRMIPDAGCEVYADLEFASQRAGDSWSGTGTWSLNFVGACTQSNYTEDFVVSGTRMATKPASSGEPSSLVERFFLHNKLVPLLQMGVTGNE